MFVYMCTSFDAEGQNFIIFFLGWNSVQVGLSFVRCVLDLFYSFDGWNVWVTRTLISLFSSSPSLLFLLVREIHKGTITSHCIDQKEWRKKVTSERWWLRRECHFHFFVWFRQLCSMDKRVDDGRIGSFHWRT